LNSISQKFGRNQEGCKFDFGYDTNFRFSVRLARVKAKTLPGIRSGSRARSG
jgi:hypothetical protein